ncbi:MAG: efflux RND transporter permease subunit [Steroidobacteraceae bacterium]
MPGVGQVSRGGGVDRQMRVDLDPARMQALGLTAVQVNQQLRDLNLDAAGGRAQVGGGEQTIRVLGGAQSALTLGDVQINLPIGGSARLRDFAEVTDGVAETRTISRLNGPSGDHLRGHEEQGQLRRRGAEAGGGRDRQSLQGIRQRQDRPGLYHGGTDQAHLPHGP